MERDLLPEKIEDESAARDDTEEGTYKESGESLNRRSERTHAEKNRDERSDRKE